MTIKVSIKRKIRLVSVVALLLVLLSVFNASPVLAHIPEGWCPIDECWKHVDGGTETGASEASVCVAAMYRAMGNAIDELWEGNPPKRSDIKIISKLPTAGAELAARCIVGIPEGETPPEWISDDPGEFVIVSDGETGLKLENFEITIVRLSTGEEYTWQADADSFPEEYFTYRNKEINGEELTWWEEARYEEVKSKPISKLEESIGMIISNDLHDNYAHHLDDQIIGKVGTEGSMLDLVSALAESGDKADVATLRSLVDESSELIDEAHELIHGKLVAAAEEMGVGQEEAENLHDIAHKMLASVYQVGEVLGDIEGTEDTYTVKELAAEMLEKAKELKELASELHVHSTDPATVLTGQQPLKLRDGTAEIEIGYDELGIYYAAMTTEEESGPVGGAVALGVVVVGLTTLGIVRRKRT